MRIAAFFVIVLLFVAGVTSTQVAQNVTAAEPTVTNGLGSAEPGGGSGGTSGASSPAAEACSVVFVAGKGQIDSCSGERKETSRVYPRKPGVPANGCVETCPEPAESTGPGANTTPGPSDNVRKDNTRAVSTPIASEYTPPIDTGQVPTAPALATDCDRVSYPDICVPSAPPYLSCVDIPDRNFRVRAPDPHRFDADGNGIGCEEVRGPTIGR